MNFKKFFTVFVLSLAVLTFATPSFAANFRINRNGSDSRNRINFTSRSRHLLEQANEVQNVNEIVVESNTGDNEAEDNTGDGNTLVSSGNVTTNVTVTNAGAANVADGSDCGCQDEDEVNARISRNGSDSVNTIDISKYFSSTKTQYNAFVNLNSVAVSSDTGDNEAEDNTGDGETNVDSGNVNTTVVVTNAGATNEL